MNIFVIIKWNNENDLHKLEQAFLDKCDNGGSEAEISAARKSVQEYFGTHTTDDNLRRTKKQSIARAIKELWGVC